MKIMVLRAFSLFTLALLANFSTALAADTNPPPRLTIELRDGSRVVGTSVEKSLKFHSTLLGDLKLAVKDIRSVDCIATNAAKLTTFNGDSMTVAFLDAEIPVKTSFGKVELAIVNVRKVSVTPADKLSRRREGLIALWSGDGNGLDVVGGNSASLSDITFVEGKVGQAFSFNGSSSTMRIPSNPALDLGVGDGFTIMAWIKPSDIDGLHPLLQWSDENPLNLWIGIRPYENGVLRGDITDTAGNHFLCTTPNTLLPGVFQHVAFSYDKSSGMGVLYLNGVVVAERQLGRQLLAKTKGDLWFSQRDDRPGNWSTGRAYAGLMDEVALYNRALAAEEIKAIFADENRGEPITPPTASVGWFESWMR